MWISLVNAATETNVPVYKVVDNSLLLVDNLWIKLELSTSSLNHWLIHRFSTTYPQLIHRVIHRVIHNFWGGFWTDLVFLSWSGADDLDIVNLYDWFGVSILNTREHPDCSISVIPRNHDGCCLGGLCQTIANFTDVVWKIDILFDLFGNFLNRIENRRMISSKKCTDFWQAMRG